MSFTLIGIVSSCVYSEESPAHSLPGKAVPPTATGAGAEGQPASQLAGDVVAVSEEGKFVLGLQDNDDGAEYGGTGADVQESDTDGGSDTDEGGLQTF